MTTPPSGPLTSPTSRLKALWSAWRIRWQHLKKLPLAFWQLPMQQQQLQHLHVLQQTLQESLEQTLREHLDERFDAHLPAQLPFALHQPDVQLLTRAKDRLGNKANDPALPEREAHFYSYFSEMAGDTRHILLQQYHAYWPLIQQVQVRLVAGEGAPWLDIGCGAGEFLQFMHGHGWPAEGIDLSATEVARCHALGLSVQQADALAFLEAPHSNGRRKYAGISLFQVIEHVPREQVVPLLQACVHSLLPGGLILVETVNLRHALAFNGFYTDPTHQTPLSDNYIAFVLQWLGLEKVGVLYTLPEPQAFVPPSEHRSHYMNYTAYGQVGLGTG